MLLSVTSAFSRSPAPHAFMTTGTIAASNAYTIAADAYVARLAATLYSATLSAPVISFST